MSSLVEMSIVPWWYARSLTILYAEPDTYSMRPRQSEVARAVEETGHILSLPTHMSFRSFTFASTPSERTALSTTCAVACRSNDARGRCMEKFVLPRSCAIDRLLRGHARAPRRYTTYVVDRASSTMSPNERNAGATRRADVDFLPRILVPAYDDTGIIAVEQE